MDYVHWWNTFRPHGSLNYASPIDYRTTWEKKQQHTRLAQVIRLSVGIIAKTG
ncbi:IS3 family transposase [Enterococcus eurekensis]